MALTLKQGAMEQLITSTFGIKEGQLEQAKKMDSQNKLGLLVNLEKMGLMNEQQAVDIQSACFGSRIIKLKNYPMNPEVQELVPEEIQKKYQLVPLTKVGNILTAATSSLFQAQAAQVEIQKSTGCLLNFVLAYPTELAERLSQALQGTTSIDDMLSDKAEELISSSEEGKIVVSDDPNGPVAQAVSFILKQAIQEGASDVHFEPFPESYRIRYRLDGLLKEVKSFDKVFINPFSAALKVKANIDIAETRLPQDGGFGDKFSGRDIDFRVATYPTKYGEKIVLRILDSNKDYINIDALLLPDQEKEKLVKMAEAPNGIILCSGPTGSGKSTTLYAMLKHVNNTDINILTIEDPIEYRIGGISQGQVNVAKGYTFSRALRAMMRLDPDIILVGEMRDLETAEIGLQAALTGHLVLSTVHANSASQTITRLFDLGIEPFIVGSAMNGVISQRLVRRICPQCKEAYAPTTQELIGCGFKPEEMPKELWRGKGCHKCNSTGFKGRLPLIELLVIANDMRPMISSGADAGAVFREALKRGMRTMADDSRGKILSGHTTTSEIIRVVGSQDRSGKPKEEIKEAA